VQKGFAVGCSDFLTKPVKEPELIAAIKTYLGE
jgi:CheY-like chemotaxis protein